MDAVYFQLGALIMAARVPAVRLDRPDAHTLGWGHAMRPGRDDQDLPLDRRESPRHSSKDGKSA
jgi:hypothetical protein